VIVSRQAAWELLTEHTKSESLINHALAVEAAMRGYARKYGADEELWAATGLVHDFDYEEHPTAEEHPLLGAQTLERLGWPAEVVDAIKGHGTHLDVPRVTPMAKVLFAVDELTGLIVACTLVRPDKNIANLAVKSVRKKWNIAGFARGVNRQDIELGATELGVDLDEHIAVVIEAMQAAAAELGLNGSQS
jgi:putative nucleotidyltransferase with HDIG domain